MSKFLLRRDLRFPAKEDNWTSAHKRWLALVAERRKPKGVATVACPREVAPFLWEAAVFD